MGIFGGPASWVVTGGQSAADLLVGSPGADSDGAVEDSDSTREARNRTVSGAANYAYASVLDTANNLGIGGVTESDVRQQWVARGEVRDLIDTTMAYEGDWGGTGDSVDLVGPAAWGPDSSLVSVASDLIVTENENSDDDGGDDPAARKTRWLIFAALAAGALFLLSPLLNLLASLVGAVGGD